MEPARIHRSPVTEWKSWRDVFATERVVDLSGRPRYTSSTLQTWTRAKYSTHDDPRPMRLSSFAWVKGRDVRHVTLDVTLTEQAIEVIRANIIHVDGDTISMEVIVWDDGRALVVAQRSQIIGGQWLAIIDASTMPEWPQEGR